MQRSALLFWGWQPNFLSHLKKIEVAASKFNLKRPLTSRALKTALPNILKVPSNQCICSKYWWELWIVVRNRKKTKRPQQWGVINLILQLTLHGSHRLHKMFNAKALASSHKEILNKLALQLYNCRHFNWWLWRTSHSKK